MSITRGLVFYSWQSDLPNPTNRSFIEEALKAAAKALKDEDSLQVEPVIDRDTTGVPGSPSITETIFRKIGQANVFVADISIVNREKSSLGRLTPNPNVLLELGYALKALGDQRVILVLNKAYGGPESLPFDLRMRRVISYDMAAENQNRAHERKRLEKILIDALRASLGNADRAFLETRNHLRPTLHPLTNLEEIIDKQHGFIQWGRQGISLSKGFENIGEGPAFNIYAILFGKPFQNHPPRERYAIWNYGTLKAGEEGPPLSLSAGTNIESTTIINDHQLYIPDDPQHNGVLARLTITYHNTHGNKYASIYDYHRDLGWMRVSDAENIEHDLRDLDAMHPMTRQANEFYWRMGQNRR